jgi:hypothetical protein
VVEERATGAIYSYIGMCQAATKANVAALSRPSRRPGRAVRTDSASSCSAWPR